MKRFLPDFVAVIVLIVLLLIAGEIINLLNLSLFISIVLALILWLALSVLVLIAYIRFITKDMDL
jgi:hypothetical protein